MVGGNYGCINPVLAVIQTIRKITFTALVELVVEGKFKLLLMPGIHLLIPEQSSWHCHYLLYHQ